MALTRAFKETVVARARSDPAFREALLSEAIQCFLSGDIDTGKVVLRDYVNATVGFRELADALGKKSESVKRMLGPKGNPAAHNLFAIVAYLQKREGVELQVRAVR